MSSEPPKPTRRRMLKLGAYGAVGALGAGYLGWSNALHVERVSRALFGLPRPLKIALVSELHAPHFWFGIEGLKEAINEARPDLVAVLGDIVDEGANVRLVRELLSGIEASVRVAIPGNWEYWGHADMKELREAYQAVGFELLINEDKRITHAGQQLRIVGLDDLLGGAPDYNLLSGSDSETPTIVLSHCPETVEPIARACSAPTVVFSGHTHGGQLAPLGVVVWTPPGSGGYVSGWYTPRPGCALYVSRGLGCSKLTLRLGACSTLDLVELG